jgi:hypothetical protein
MRPLLAALAEKPIISKDEYRSIFGGIYIYLCLLSVL